MKVTEYCSSGFGYETKGLNQNTKPGRRMRLSYTI